MNLEKICRYCEHLDPREDIYYGYNEVYMCYKYKDSNYCGIDYKSLCDKFEWCNDLKEVMNGRLD
ncbi:MAG: hypothetical protein ACRCX2_20540 [Paraclostridium sp.]